MQSIEVYEVGKNQLWGWCSWTGRGLDCGGYGSSMDCNASTLRKGAYVVVEGSAKFGRMGKPWVVCAQTSLRKALRAAGMYAMYAPEYLSTQGIAHEYEVWHIVDDGELWSEWELRAAMAWADSPNYDFDETAEDAYPFGDCWESCVDACTPDLGLPENPCEHGKPCAMCPNVGAAGCDYNYAGSCLEGWDVDAEDMCSEPYYVVELFGQNFGFASHARAAMFAMAALSAWGVEPWRVKVDRRRVCVGYKGVPYIRTDGVYTVDSYFLRLDNPDGNPYC